MIRTFPELVSLLGLVALGCSSDALDAGAGGASGRSSEGGGTLGGGAHEGHFATSVETTPRALYPDGPYGRGVGAVVANLSFLGWRDPAKAGYDPTQLERVSLSDFYNPGGTANDVRLILLNASAVWCSVCKAEYKHMRDSRVYSTYRARGVEVLGVLFEDARFNPAKPTDLVVWGGTDGGFSVPFPLVVDPSFKVGVYFDSDATPMNMLIDATTMRILNVTMGYDSRTPEKYWTYVDSFL